MLVSAAAPSTDDVPTIGPDNVSDDVILDENVVGDDCELAAEVLVIEAAEEVRAPNAAEEYVDVDDVVDEVNASDEVEEAEDEESDVEVSGVVEEVPSEVREESWVEDAATDAAAAEAAEAAEDNIELTCVYTELASETMMLKRS